jgi:hypothetical protein
MTADELSVTAAASSEGVLERGVSTGAAGRATFNPAAVLAADRDTRWPGRSGRRLGTGRLGPATHLTPNRISDVLAARCSLSTSRSLGSSEPGHRLQARAPSHPVMRDEWASRTHLPELNCPARRPPHLRSLLRPPPTPEAPSRPGEPRTTPTPLGQPCRHLELGHAYATYYRPF